MSWLFAEEKPLPPGLELVPVPGVARALGKKRLATAEDLLGKAPAKAAAESLGRYELEESLARQLELEGLELGEGGEVPALSPARWASHLDSQSWEGLRARVSAGGAEIAGLRLPARQREAFLRFLSRHRVSAEPAKVVELALHFFADADLNVVIRHTVPRFPAT